MQNVKLARGWLALAVASLGISGVFSILLVVARTTNYFNDLGEDYLFQTSLILHVNLSILVWFLACASMVFAAKSPKHHKVSFYTTCIGTLLMVLSPFILHGEPILNNYVPFFKNDIFMVGLILFFMGIFAESYYAIFEQKNYRTKSLALIIFFAFGLFAYSANDVLDYPGSFAYYESLFWEFGHALQFAYVQIAMICWLKLAEKSGLKFNKQTAQFKVIFYLPLVFLAVTTTLIYLAATPETTEHIELFTKQMFIGTSIGAVPLGIIILVKLFDKISRAKLKDPIFSALSFSLIVFALGGVLGGKAAESMARGDITTVIPAHYHGSIIGVTIALMGYVYYFLPKLGLHEVKRKTANIQIWLYSVGQIMYISGLAILGGHGAARKTPGIDQLDVSMAVKQMMQWGGLLTLIGGFIFVWLVYKSFTHKKHK